MSEEENKETTETLEEPKEEAKEEVATESKEEPTEEPKEEAAPEENAEVKALTEKVDAMANEVTELKAKLAKPVRKSKVEQKDESGNFVEEKAKNPLDLIA